MRSSGAERPPAACVPVACVAHLPRSTGDSADSESDSARFCVPVACSAAWAPCRCRCRLASRAPWPVPPAASCWSCTPARAGRAALSVHVCSAQSPLDRWIYVKPEAAALRGCGCVGVWMCAWVCVCAQRPGEPNHQRRAGPHPPTSVLIIQWAPKGFKLGAPASCVRGERRRRQSARARTSPLRELDKVLLGGTPGTP